MLDVKNVKIIEFITIKMWQIKDGKLQGNVNSGFKSVK